MLCWLFAVICHGTRLRSICSDLCKVVLVVDSVSISSILSEPIGQQTITQLAAPQPYLNGMDRWLIGNFLLPKGLKLLYPFGVEHI